MATTINLAASQYQTIATVSGGNCGSLYGELAANGGLTVKGIRTFTGGGGDCYGCVAGLLTTDSLTDVVLLEDLTVSPTVTSFSSFGGVFGRIDSQAYVKVKDVTVNAGGSGSGTSFGGIIGATDPGRSVFVDLGDFTLNADSGGFNGGGVVGTFDNGVLRLSGTTNMSSGKPADADNCGQLIGKNKDVLVYAVGTGADASPTQFTSGWRYIRSNGAIADDLGTWGEVVRCNNLISFDSSAHTVTITGIKLDATDSDYQISTPEDFVKTALSIQFNKGDNSCISFTSDSASSANVLSGTITLKADISLTGTGIIGLMRDGGDADDIGVFTGTLDGTKPTDENHPTDDKYKITLCTGEPYGLDHNGNPVVSSSEGVGQIYRHKLTGLISVLGGTVSNLIIDGSINVHNRVDGMNIGGVAAKCQGTSEIKNVTAKAAINYKEATAVTGTEAAGKNIGGLVGIIDAIGTEISVNESTSVESALNLKGAHGNWAVYGGAIGKITADSFTVNIGTVFDNSKPVSNTNPLNKLTMKMTTDLSGITSVEDNSDCGGLIGIITKAGSYGNRKVNINNLEYNGCSIGNAATTTGGGLLGYSWLNTTTTIDGMTVTSAAINNCTVSGGSVVPGGNSDFGAMCYQATGKWVVNDLNAGGLTVSDGAADSLGKIVNKAYTEGEANADGSTNYTGALYLDVLNSGYTCPGSVPASSKTDDFVAYSAKTADDILTGGAGVISINMNTSRAGTPVDSANVKKVRVVEYDSVTGTGTITSGSVNPTSRYYYNLDFMDNTDGGQNLLLWSVGKYANKLIADEFIEGKGADTSFGTTLTTTSNNAISLGTTLSGTANMTGLSFYPLALADGITIGDLTLTLDYAGIEGVTGITMDPGATDTAKNQHYLMHSGLFIDSSENTKLTISGNLTLAGSFLEVDDYKGVLISDTMRGELDGSAGSITLNGIKPYTTEGVAYTDGYLLINNIKRKDTSVKIPELKLYNVKQGTGYSGVVAKSLIGPAVGPFLKMEFSNVKLAGDTTNAIFSQATLVDSIRTDQNAQLIYNFTWDDDWGASAHNVTYGREITASVEYSNQEKSIQVFPEQKRKGSMSDLTQRRMQVPPNMTFRVICRMFVRLIQITHPVRMASIIVR